MNEEIYREFFNRNFGHLMGYDIHDNFSSSSLATFIDTRKYIINNVVYDTETNIVAITYNSCSYVDFFISSEKNFACKVKIKKS